MNHGDLEHGLSASNGLGGRAMKKQNGRACGQEVFVHGAPRHGPGQKNIAGQGQRSAMVRL
jgi:hypothetical protein